MYANDVHAEDFYLVKEIPRVHTYTASLTSPISRLSMAFHRIGQV